VVIRDLRPGDFDDLRENYYACYDERAEGAPIGIVLFRERPSIEAETKWFEGLAGGFGAGDIVAVVAEEGGHAVGLCTVGHEGASRESEAGHVGMLGILIRRGFRGRGLGTALLEAALDRCRGRFEVVRLAVFADNEGAQRLYEKMGFQVIGTVPKAIKRGDRFIDERLMVRLA
jgi:RimJ/RimL family protein N-acetyltransferase